MGYLISLVTISFLTFSVLFEILALSSRSMYDSSHSASDRQGVFLRCQYRQCSWLDMKQFSRDPQWLQAVSALAFISILIMVLFTFIYVLSFLPKFQSSCLKTIIAFLLCSNVLVLIVVIIVYTTLNGKNINFFGGFITYSWSYWFLYAVLPFNLLTAFFVYYDKTKKFSSNSSLYYFD